MKRALVAVVVVFALAAGGYALFEAGARHGASGAGHATGPVASGAADAAGTSASTAATDRTDPKTGRRVLYWHDPMVPGHRFDKPGKSPFMNMELVPVFADESGGASGVSIDPRLAQSLGIRTADVVRGRIGQPIEAVGAVAYNDRDVAVVQARANGWIERLHVRAPLDPVRKGDVLAEIYVPDWVTAQEEFLTVRRMKLGDSLVDGARQRMRLAGMSDEQIAVVESSASVQPRMKVTAPIGGIVVELQAREGTTVMTGATLFRLNGLGTVWVNAEVPETVAASIRPGMTVEATTAALPGRVFKGRVGAVLPEISATTRTVKARVELANSGGQLIPGMFAKVVFAMPGATERLLVPSEAVIRTGRRSVVMVASADGRFAPVDVETGIEADGRIEIRKGLAEGQKVVASGQFLVDSEASLKGIETRLQAPAAGSSGTQPGRAADSSQPAGGSVNATAERQSVNTGATGAASSAGASKGGVHQAQGRIDSIDGSEMMVSHGPVESLKWPSMTMGFRLRSGAAPAGVKPGDSITFEFRQAGDGEYEIVTLRRVAPASQGPAGSKR